MSHFFVKNKKYFLYSLFFFSFIVQSSDMNIQDTPSIVFNHSNDFLSEFSIPMPKNEDEYHALIEKANSGNIDANWMLAVIQQTEGYRQEASKRYKLSISRNDKYKLRSMVNLGFILEDENRYSDARALFELAGKSGYFEGYRTIGTNYLNGIGVNQDFNKAKEYFNKGSQIGCHECTFLINNWSDVIKLKKSE
ncbi:hypothetical protein BA1DRAFT_00678 [Photorhabdus aegyptia]|uniref:Sel1 repeat family protein n=2 Tax=Photorhabdus aegyptia TaxID=2805098 RepID=A0A022PPF1_9GAMM|nr:hypothetical protein BA1DRAFT_00678 [Photorhabdus aegyptia]